MYINERPFQSDRPLHTSTHHYIPLQTITLHYITLHYIPYKPLYKTKSKSAPKSDTLSTYNTRRQALTMHLSQGNQPNPVCHGLLVLCAEGKLDVLVEKFCRFLVLKTKQGRFWPSCSRVISCWQATQKTLAASRVRAA